ncbi:hypothetical protein ACFIQF_08215 [Comamonas sp. J-3]|jgi:hypothetical protein|uniref:hypothetical protein n=1 Tax=Comamonas trifloxystrobinivorans TaxID=3350256 RepID=UPI00372A04B2
MAYTTHAQAFEHAAGATPSHHHVTAKRACLGVLLLCIAIAALALPLVREALDLVQPRMQWQALAQWLAQAPMASWLMMFVWGSLVPVSFLLMLRFHRNWLGALAALGFALVAVLWYANMPSQTQCAALYGDSNWCTLITWGYSLSLGIANAVYLFALVMLMLGGLSFATLPQDDEEDKPA